jgi:cytochrome c5
MHFKTSLLALIGAFVVIFGTHTFFNGLIKVTYDDNATVAQRIAPIGGSYIEGEIDVTAIKTAKPVKVTGKKRSGKDIYTATCSACHAVGVLSAPKFKNSKDWAPRLKQGIDNLVKIAIKGKGAMPPKGTCGNCSEAELKSAIEYMSQ